MNNIGKFTIINIKNQKYKLKNHLYIPLYTKKNLCNFISKKYEIPNFIIKNFLYHYLNFINCLKKINL